MRIAFVLVIATLLIAVQLLIGSSPDPAEARSPAVDVPKSLLRFDDGDTVAIHWTRRREEVRILGIDTPEVMHLEHELPYPQPFGYEAAGFLRGCIAVADRVQLLRSGQKDPYGRTLGYLLLDGKNYSVLAVTARMAVENVSHYGDNGMPAQAARVRAAAKTAGPVPFEPPHQYRKRMKAVSKWMQERGSYPK